ncbi:hypothetical protein ISR92_02340 [Patescibacteria group bacterium]|nr:hypothetical protein [Patescibacteria group bacterium]
MTIDPKYKRILMILGFIAIVFLMAWFLYSMFFAPTPPPVIITPPAGQPIGGLPDIGDDTGDRPVSVNPVTGLPITSPDLPYIRTDEVIAVEADTVIDHEVIAISKTTNGSLVYYNGDDGKFYSYASGQITPLSDKSFYDVENIAWSRKGDRAILEYPDGHNIFYDFSKEKQISLPKELQDFSFDQSGEKIAAKVISDFPDNNWIVTTNFDGSGVLFVEHLGEKEKDVQIDWSPAGEIVATYREGIDFERQEVFPIGQSGGNIKSLVTDGRGFESSWSPQGDFILYSVYNTKSGYRPTLYLADMGGDWTGSYKVDIGINTWSDKCVFTNSSQKVYCAVPEELPELSGIFRDLADGIQDVFYEINLITGSKRMIAAPDDVSAIGLQVSTDSSTLYFVNEMTGNLEEIGIR